MLGVTLERASASEVTEILRKNGMPICFEEAPASETLSVTEAVAELEKIPAGERTNLEKTRLATLAIMLKNDPNTAVRLTKLNRFHFECTGFDNDPPKMLDALVAADPAYAWKQLGSRYIVYPRAGSRLDPPTAAFTAKAQSYPALLATLNKDVFAAWSVHCSGLFGPRNAATLTKRYTIELGPTTGWQLLQTVADQFGPSIIWVEQSTGEGRTLYFTDAHLVGNLHPWN